MEDFGYKNENDENYTKALIKKALLLGLILFSIFCFLYIGVNAYNYFQNNKVIKTIKPKTAQIKSYPNDNMPDKDSKIKIDSSIYEDIFGTRKKKEEVKVKKNAKPAVPPKEIKITHRQPEKKMAAKKNEVKTVSIVSNKRNPNGRKRSRVQLAAMTSKESALRFLKITKSKYPQIFSGLDGYIQEVDLGKRGIFFRVQIGDFYDQIRAENFCKKYVAAAQKSRSDCIIVE